VIGHRIDETEPRCVHHEHDVATRCLPVDADEVAVIGAIASGAGTLREIAEAVDLAPGVAGAILGRLEGRRQIRRALRPGAGAAWSLPAAPTRPAQPTPTPPQEPAMPASDATLVALESRVLDHLRAASMDQRGATATTLRDLLRCSGGDIGTVLARLRSRGVVVREGHRYKLAPDTTSEGERVEAPAPAPAPTPRTGHPKHPMWVYVAAPLAGVDADTEWWHHQRARLVARWWQAISPGSLTIVPHDAVRPLYGDGSPDTGDTRARGMAHCVELVRLVCHADGDMIVLARDDGTITDGCAAEVAAWRAMCSSEPTVLRWADIEWPEALRAEAEALAAVSTRPQLLLEREVVALEGALDEVRAALAAVGVPASGVTDSGSTVRYSTVDMARDLLRHWREARAEATISPPHDDPGPQLPPLPDAIPIDAEQAEVVVELARAHVAALQPVLDRATRVGMLARYAAANGVAS
jgi:DNA-binding MarR family transcriptional regulator